MAPQQVTGIDLVTAVGCIILVNMAVDLCKCTQMVRGMKCAQANQAAVYHPAMTGRIV